MDEALYACRFLQFTTAMLIFGVAAFRVYALPSSASRSVSHLFAEFDACFGRVLFIASLAALISAIALLFCQTAEMAGSSAAAADLAAVSAVLFDTYFGRVWCGHLLFAVVLALACLHQQLRRRLVLIFSLGLLASLAWVGHAVMDHGAARIAHELNQTGHLFAAGLWLGGLMPLAWVLRKARQSPGNVEIALARDALRNFSYMGYVAVGLLALTGAANTLFLVGSLGTMFGTPYGRLLAVKILLFLTMVIVASINRFHLAPRISRDPGALRMLGGAVAIEQALAVAVLAIVSVLGTWPPGFSGGNR